VTWGGSSIVEERGDRVREIEKRFKQVNKMNEREGSL
jgi:hypothetical protein